MTDLLFPPWLRVSAVVAKHVSNDAESRSVFTGAPRTSSRSGKRWRFGFRTNNASDLTDPEKAGFFSFISQLGKNNRVICGKPGYRQRGSFVSTELISNSTFANGTTGWTVTSGGALSVADRMGRMTVTQAAALQEFFMTATTTQYAPHVARAFVMNGDATSGKTIGPFMDGGYATNYSTTRGLVTVSAVPNTASGSYGVGGWSADVVAGAYYLAPYVSVSRCFQVDNGPCLITQSNAFGDATWTASQLTVTSNIIASPDGASTADRLAETVANTTHQIGRTTATTVSSSAADFTFSVAVKSYGGRTHCWIQIVEGSGSTAVFQVFNLSTGALGSTSSTGANWSNLRSKIKALGNDWYYLTITARKTNAATTLNFYVGASAGDHASAYVGSTTSGVYVYCATPAQSSVPTRLVQTTSTALATGTAQTGSDIYVKGGPATAAGSLLAGDLCQIGTQLQELVAALNFDAAGLAYLQMHRALRSSPSDSAPVIVNNPMGRFVVVGTDIGQDDNPGNVADFEMELEEDVYS
jgi:hypothetical protein